MSPPELLYDSAGRAMIAQTSDLDSSWIDPELSTFYAIFASLLLSKSAWNFHF
jgi:hypothetical protein